LWTSPRKYSQRHKAILAFASHSGTQKGESSKAHKKLQVFLAIDRLGGQMNQLAATMAK